MLPLPCRTTTIKMPIPLTSFAISCDADTMFLVCARFLSLETIAIELKLSQNVQNGLNLQWILFFR